MSDSTELYNITPAGLSSPYSESLSSYISRIAELHCISVGDLINKIIIPTINKRHLIRASEEGGNRLFDNSYLINGSTGTSKDFIRALEELTGRKSLALLSMTPLENYASERSLNTKVLNWCPFCYKNMVDEMGFCFTPLAWSFQCINHCEVHSIPLKSECSNCNQQIPILRRNSINGVCPYCLSSLFDTELYGIKRASESIDSYNIFKVNSVSQLISRMNNNIDRTFISERLKDLIKGQNITTFCKKVDVPVSTFMGWINDTLPVLNSLLKVLYICNVSLDKFFSMETIEIDYRDHFIVESRTPPNRKKLNHTYIEKELIVWLESKEILSMVEVAKRIGVNKRSLYRYFPNYCKKISARYKVFTYHSSELRKKKLRNRIENSILYLMNNGEKPTNRRIGDHLNEESILRESFAKKVKKEIIFGIER